MMNIGNRTLISLHVYRPGHITLRTIEYTRGGASINNQSVSETLERGKNCLADNAPINVNI